MDSERFNYLLNRYGYDQEARNEVCHYWLANIKRRLNSKYGNTIDVDDVAHNILAYVMEHRPTNKVYAPFKYINKCVSNYIASHLQLFDKTLPLLEVEETSYEQKYSELEKMNLMRVLESELKNKDSAMIVYKRLVDGEKEKDIAKEMGISYTNVRAIICRGRKKLKNYYSKCNKK